MENKIKLKKYLLITIISSFILISFFLIINIYEYHIYTNNFNNKIMSIISKIESDYKEISEEEIMTILNSDDEASTVFDKYSLNINNNSIVKENEEVYNKFLILNISFIIITIFILIIIFLKFNSKRDKEINEITRYIEEINKKNYSLHIDDISEDELSILKNEIYKTTVMLKEDAEISKKDKLELKKSLSDISHQLKTPLTSILIILDNLIDDPNMDKDTKEDFIRDIKREIININFLVQSILKLSKLDSNTVHFIKERITLNELVNESIKNVLSLSDLKNVKIITNFYENCDIVCDIKWQVEAITNIIKNCIEHSSSGDSVEITTESNKMYSMILIRDYGDGIDEDDLPHIFERFYKGRNASSESIGIGLALSKSIIESNNGSISVETSSDGTKFYIKYYK